MRIKNQVYKICFIILFFLIYITLLSAQNNIVKYNKVVYFFCPSTTELDTIDENNLDAIDDFNYYTNRVIPFLKINNIKSEYLTDRKIEIIYDIDSSITVNRDSINFGTIFTDGKNKPKILKYVLTDDVLKKEIKTYFKLK